MKCVLTKKVVPKPASRSKETEAQEIWETAHWCLFRNCNISILAIPMIRCSLDVPVWAYFSQLLHVKEDAAKRQAKIAPNIVAANNQIPD